MISVGYGNGKRHHTPTPKRLRKIKRISFESFLSLKELFKDFKRDAIKPQKLSNYLSPRASTINDLKTGIHPTRGLVSTKRTITQDGHRQAYEPTQIYNTRNSSFWRWRRVREWDKYINDPLENINGHIIT